MDIRELVPWQWSSQSTPRSASYNDPFFRLHDQVDQLWKDLFPSAQGRTKQSVDGFVPSLNVEEDQESVRITVEVPGLQEKDMDITFEEGRVVIQGEKRLERKEQADGNRTYYESRYGSFTRVVPLRTAVDEDNSEAELKDGVLTITLPKAQPEKNGKKKISVKSS